MTWAKTGLGFLRFVAFFALALVISTIAVAGSILIKCIVPTADSGWAQAIGAILAILAGFAGVVIESRRERRKAEGDVAEGGKAAHLIAFDALQTVTERLEAALAKGRTVTMRRLKGERTNEMVAAMRELDVSRIPSDMLADFIRLRSRVHAINARITELYRDENAQPNDTLKRSEARKRYTYLTSAVAVWNDAVTHFDNLQIAAARHGSQPQTLSVPDVITDYQRPT